MVYEKYTILIQQDENNK